MSSLLFHTNSHSDAEKGRARNYLVIPKDRRVYLVWASDMNYKMLTAVCHELLQSEKGNYVVYVLLERDSELRDSLRSCFSQDQTVQIIILNGHIGTFFEAADVILTKLGAIKGIELPDHLSRELSKDRIEVVSPDTLRDTLKRLQKNIFRRHDV